MRRGKKMSKNNHYLTWQFLAWRAMRPLTVTGLVFGLLFSIPAVLVLYFGAADTSDTLLVATLGFGIFVFFFAMFLSIAVSMIPRCVSTLSSQNRFMRTRFNDEMCRAGITKEMYLEGENKFFSNSVYQSRDWFIFHSHSRFFAFHRSFARRINNLRDAETDFRYEKTGAGSYSVTFADGMTRRIMGSVVIMEELTKWINEPTLWGSDND
jgi:hypothetical protein